MIEKIIEFFSKRHLLTNFITLAIFMGGIFFWTITPREELPELEGNSVRVTTIYSGASPDEVEHFITKPIEDEMKGINGIDRITSNSSMGVSSIRIELDDNIKDQNEVVNDITDAVNRVQLPAEIRDDPVIRRWKTSQKAILDVAIIHKDHKMLDDNSRRELHQYVNTLKQQLLNLPEVSTINEEGYLKPEIQILARPEDMRKYNISFNSIITAIKKNHLRQPAGTIEDKTESKVTLLSELNSVEKLDNLIIRGSFEGQEIRLKQLANVVNAFEKNNSITKINGHEGIILNIVKTSSTGIIVGVDKIKEFTRYFQNNSLKDKPVQIINLDDESIDVRQRLSLIGLNALIGFMLILIILFIFLNIRASFWVAMGIPFSFCFTMVITSLMGYTINNITLAAVIIVMGMIVDDAIVVAENISRLRHEGYDNEKAAVQGTARVFLPIIASITTTCVAFMPLLFFSGRMAKLIAYIPPIISIMLLGSLFESLFILPAHMNLHLPAWIRKSIASLQSLFYKNYKKIKTKSQNSNGILDNENRTHWFDSVETRYGKFLEKLLNYKFIALSFFILILLFSAYIFNQKMKFVMFPDEDSKELMLMAETKIGTNSRETARLAWQIESILSKSIGKEVVGFRTYIAQSRHGRTVEENKFASRIELVSKEKRSKSLKQIKKEWEDKLKNVKNLYNVRFFVHRWGQNSGSPVEIMVKDNNETVRKKAVNMLYAEMNKFSVLKNVEIDKPMENTEYKISIKHDKLNQLSLDPTEISSTLRTGLQGTILYELIDGDENIDVKISAVDNAKSDINKILQFPVKNEGQFLLPLSDLVNIKRVITPYSIDRDDYQRTTKIFSEIRGMENYNNRKPKKNKTAKEKNSIKPETKIKTMTPLEIADYLEKNIFPKIYQKYPTTVIKFDGEIKDSRESTGDFKWGIIMVIFLIYSILALLFNSLSKPFIIMLTIPFGLVGIILAFWLHGIAFYGFFAVIGTLGLAGVVVNDSIIMIVKLEKEYNLKKNLKFSNIQIASIAQTRLRAVLLTTLTTVAGLFPTAYGIAGYDSMLAEMMFTMGWGLLFATFITLVLVPIVYSILKKMEHAFHHKSHLAKTGQKQ